MDINTKVFFVINIYLIAVSCVSSTRTVLNNGDIIDVETIESGNPMLQKLFQGTGNNPVTIEFVTNDRGGLPMQTYENNHYNRYNQYRPQSQLYPNNQYPGYYGQPYDQRYGQRPSGQIGKSPYTIRKHATNPNYPNFEVYTLDITNPGLNQYPHRNTGNYQYPNGNSNFYQYPNGNNGNYQYPNGNNGNYQYPNGNNGNYQYPNGNNGNYQYPNGNNGNYQYPNGNNGNYPYPNSHNQYPPANNKYPNGNMYPNFNHPNDNKGGEEEIKYPFPNSDHKHDHNEDVTKPNNDEIHNHPKTDTGEKDHILYPTINGKSEEYDTDDTPGIKDKVDGYLGKFPIILLKENEIRRR